MRGLMRFFNVSAVAMVVVIFAPVWRVNLLKFLCRTWLGVTISWPLEKTDRAALAAVLDESESDVMNAFKSLAHSYRRRAEDVDTDIKMNIERFSEKLIQYNDVCLDHLYRLWLVGRIDPSLIAGAELPLTGTEAFAQYIRNRREEQEAIVAR